MTQGSLRRRLVSDTSRPLRRRPQAIPSGSPTHGGTCALDAGAGWDAEPPPQRPYIYAVVMVNGSPKACPSRAASRRRVRSSTWTRSPQSIRFSLLDGTFANGLKQVSLLKGTS